uniref:Cystatin domain-containing protein n=1 Tax=Seriola lalandi dorsalis TaxID=1841481 RepID=A0A3B4X2L0_SERLL
AGRDVRGLQRDDRQTIPRVYQTQALERATQASGRNGMLTSRPTVVEAASQVVAGTNYFVKLRLASGEYVHARIYDHFGSVTLTAVQVAKS